MPDKKFTRRRLRRAQSSRCLGSSLQGPKPSRLGIPVEQFGSDGEMYNTFFLCVPLSPLICAEIRSIVPMGRGYFSRASRHFVPGYYQLVPPGQKPLALPRARRAKSMLMGGRRIECGDTTLTITGSNPAQEIIPNTP
jgi:hypothetical protein